ncbi:MAG: hypothetical protein M3O80_05460 [Chloroflexota bacterium]|nr:hypothetical protein [Chloroflexota bacterium]
MSSKSLSVMEVDRPLIVAGLAIGAVFGFAGGIAGPGGANSLLYAISSAGLIVGCLFATLSAYERGMRVRAAGFACLALAEAVMHSGTGGANAESAFAGGALLYVPALLLIAAEAGLSPITRAAGALAALPFGVHSVAFYLGADVSYAGPLAQGGYVLLSLAIIGWIVSALRAPSPRRIARTVPA